MWNRHLVRYAAPILALAFCLGVVLGGSLPELGNLAMYYIFKDVTYQKSHFFNDHFLVAGVLGVVICGFALYRRLLPASAAGVVRKR